MLKRGSRGESVRKLQQALKQGGFSPGPVDGKFGSGTEAALMAFQRSEGLLADGVAGPLAWSALLLPEIDSPQTENALDFVTLPIVAALFPDAPMDNIRRHLPGLLQELRVAGLSQRPLVLMALATVRAETAGFEPISERPSRFNTSPDGSPFDLYDFRKDLGNRGPADGADYRGRGFIQLTGRANYARIGRALGMGDRLLTGPERANDSQIAARILAGFLKEKRIPILTALLNRDLRAARRLVNGGVHGISRFVACYRQGEKLFPDAAAISIQAGDTNEGS